MPVSPKRTGAGAERSRPSREIRRGSHQRQSAEWSSLWLARNSPKRKDGQALFEPARLNKHNKQTNQQLLNSRDRLWLGTSAPKQAARRDQDQNSNETRDQKSRIRQESRIPGASEVIQESGLGGGGATEKEQHACGDGATERSDVPGGFSSHI